MSILLSLYIFVVGLVFGSFYNVVGFRVIRGASIVLPSSHCPVCGHRLIGRDLIPVISYLALRGKCRACGEKISLIYPLVEISTALLFLLSFRQATSFETFLSGCLLVSLLMIVLVTDLSCMLIPDKILLFFLILFAAFRTIFDLSLWWEPIAGSATGFLLLTLISIISGGGIGGGDIKLFAVMGLLLDIEILLLGFFLSVLFGALAGLVSLPTGMMKRHQPIPFVPFIALGTLTAFFFGNCIIAHYLKLVYSF